MLYHKKPLDMEVIEETLMTYRIQARGQMSPLKFKVFYKAMQAHSKKADLRIFVSTFHKEPSEAKH